MCIEPLRHLASPPCDPPFEPISGAFNDSEVLKIERTYEARTITAFQKQYVECVSQAQIFLEFQGTGINISWLKDVPGLFFPKLVPPFLKKTKRVALKPALVFPLWKICQEFSSKIWAYIFEYIFNALDELECQILEQGCQVLKIFCFAKKGGRGYVGQNFKINNFLEF